MDAMDRLKSLLSRRSAMFSADSTDDSATHKPVVAVAPDKFKGTLTAGAVTDIITNYLESAIDADVRRYPMADGGEGTAEILASEMLLSPATVEVTDAYGSRVEITYFTNGSIVAVDSAAIVGLGQRNNLSLNPWLATTYGIGEFIRKHLNSDVQRIYIGVGGTATVDAGVGMLQALGARFFDISGSELGRTIPLCANDLCNIFSANFSNIPIADIKRRVVVLADVDVPLLPPACDALSSLSFASQKGLSSCDFDALEASLANFRDAVDAELFAPVVEPRFQGAGGGLGYAFGRILKCEMHPGARFVIDLYGIFASQPTPDVIITGEGRFDEQTDSGKVVAAITDEAERRSIPALIVAGDSTVKRDRMILTSAFLGTSEKLTPMSAERSLQKSLPHIVNSIKAILRRKYENLA